MSVLSRSFSWSSSNLTPLFSALFVCTILCMINTHVVFVDSFSVGQFSSSTTVTTIPLKNYNISRRKSSCYYQLFMSHIFDDKERNSIIQQQQRQEETGDKTSLQPSSSIQEVVRTSLFALLISILSATAVISATEQGLVPPAFADTGAEVRGTSLTPFNGLMFQYRGSDFNGLQASDIDEPSISYTDFIQQLKNGNVINVQFYAPHGDVAYATIKGDGSSTSTTTTIRIGEGYPIEQFDGYSSPAFAIRAVKNANVPYKFIVSALTKTSKYVEVYKKDFFVNSIL